MTIEYDITLGKLKSIFDDFNKAVKDDTQEASKWTPLDYSEWRNFKKFFTKEKMVSLNDNVSIEIDPDKDDAIFQNDTTRKVHFMRIVPNSFLDFLRKNIMEETKKNMVNNTTTTTASGITYDTKTTALPNYYATINNNSSNAMWVDYSGQSYNTWAKVPNKIDDLEGVKITKEGIYINGKKVLTEEDKSMTDKKFLDMKIEFGPLEEPLCALTPFGIAIRTLDNNYSYYDSEKCEIVDCTPFTFDTKKFLYKMPVAISDIAVGDVIMHYNIPMFVKGLEDNEGRIVVIDITQGEEKYILPKRNIFGFNYVTKIVSLLDMKNSGASAQNPFGNMLPFLLMQDSKELDPMMLLMLNQSGNTPAFGAMTQNPLMLMMLMKDDKNLKDILPFLMMTSLMPQQK